MISDADLHSSFVEYDLPNPNSTGNICGHLSIRYEVRRYYDVRNSKLEMSYYIIGTYRMSVPPQGPFAVGAYTVTAYDGYPVLLNFSPALGSPTTYTNNQSINVLLHDYSPRTINTSVNASTSQSLSNQSSLTAQHTSGSSLSQSNTYGGQAQVGLAPDAITGGLSANYSHTSTNETNQSNTSGLQTGTTADHNQSDSMSIKDWGAYCAIDNIKTTPSWSFGQEFPWNVILFNSMSADGSGISLPPYTISNLSNADGSQAFPPSELSLFGVDVVMKSVWLTSVVPGADDDTATLSHAAEIYYGSHATTPSQNQSGDPSSLPIVTATLSSAGLLTIPEVSLNLNVLALDPIRHNHLDNGAVVGFVANKMLYGPDDNGIVRTVSGNNTVYVTATGFDEVMTADLSVGQATLTIWFKIIEDVYEYDLAFRHWISTTGSALMTVVINDGPAIVRHIDAMEGQGGDNNVQTIGLRNKNFQSRDYHDFLIRGTNKVVVTIEQTSAEITYTLAALAITSPA